MKNKSFTLIELLVVIVIIGILAGVIIVSTSSSISKANIAKVKVFENSIQNELGANMVSRWKLDGNANDAWGSNNGTLVNDPILKTEAECVTGGCYSFDGSNDYIEVAPSTILNQNYTGFTVSTWVKYTGVQLGTDALGYIIHKNNTQHEGSAPFVLLIYGKKIQWQTYNGTIKTLIKSPLDYNDGVWHNLVGVYNGTQIILYIDSVNIGSAAVTSFANNDGYLSIGGTRYESTHRPFKGLIDDVRIYNAALSTSQIKQEYVAGLNSLLANNNISKEEYDQRINSLALNND